MRAAFRTRAVAACAAGSHITHILSYGSTTMSIYIAEWSGMDMVVPTARRRSSLARRRFHTTVRPAMRRRTAQTETPPTMGPMLFPSASLPEVVSAPTTGTGGGATGIGGGATGTGGGGGGGSEGGEGGAWQVETEPKTPVRVVAQEQTVPLTLGRTKTLGPCAGSARSQWSLRC